MITLLVLLSMVTVIYNQPHKLVISIIASISFKRIVTRHSIHNSWMKFGKKEPFFWQWSSALSCFEVHFDVSTFTPTNRTSRCAKCCRKCICSASMLESRWNFSIQNLWPSVFLEHIGSDSLVPTLANWKDSPRILGSFQLRGWVIRISDPSARVARAYSYSQLEMLTEEIFWDDQGQKPSFSHIHPYYARVMVTLKTTPFLPIPDLTKAWLFLKIKQIKILFCWPIIEREMHLTW